MAERKRFASKASQRNDRNTAENSQSPSPSDPEETTRKQIAQQPTPMDVDRTDRGIEIVQSREQSSDSQNPQLAAGSTANIITDCQGPAQVGSTNTSTVYNGPIYNFNISHIHHHNPNQPPQQTKDYSEYIRRIEQTAASSVSVNCKECLPYHHSDHPPLGGHIHNHPESDARHIPQLSPSEQQREEIESSEKTETVTTTHTDTANSSQTRPVSLELASKSTRILDRLGQALEPGDGVEIGGMLDGKWAVYVGNQEVVRCYRETRRVERDRLDLKKSFRKLRVHRRGDGSVFPSQVRIERAVSRVGTEYWEGDGLSDLDFLFWCHTGLTSWEQAVERGFGMY